jgi:hypothetical protein
VITLTNQTAGFTVYSFYSGIEPEVSIAGQYWGGITYEKKTRAPGVIIYSDDAVVGYAFVTVRVEGVEWKRD